MEESYNNENIEENQEIAVNDDGIKIADDVVAIIASTAVSEVRGVASMAGGLAGVFGGKTKGIKVDVENKEAKIDVNIIVEYGVRIPDIAFEIQSRVKKAVESMTGLKVLNVNVHIQGISTNNNSEQKEEASEEIDKAE